ncbi:uncharacterized protein EV420DRAFT_1500511 [Desarmillaria tabescens]|uniref:Uncharacterized protein n=1 Tax=Armillaria tabescens TaxID=1929756 RepID=A0AA39NRY3_ARMTA|nr:uncharacterized protein EV420DRAFT_1500511 [Desarmillaria tabescens]KAK0470408.1 hypothetical protein EV420DRAFT_1500511 [Desarmillaria tabescens]
MHLFCFCSSLACILLLLERTVQGRLVNATIDDQNPMLLYSPEDGWRNSNVPCPSCTARPDPSMAINGSWHDSTFDQNAKNSPNKVRNVSTIFNGTAIHVTCILAKTTTSPFGNSDMSFYIDDILVGQFKKTAPGESGFEYNVTVYSNSSIPSGQHKFTIQNGHVGGIKSLLLLDALVYSYDDGQSDSDDVVATKDMTTTYIGTTIGCAIAGVITGILGTIAFLLYRRRRRSRQLNEHINIEGRINRGLRTPISTISPFRTTQSFSDYHHPPPTTASVSSFTAASNPSLRNADKRAIPDTHRRVRCENTTPRDYRNAEEGLPSVDEEASDIWSCRGTRAEDPEETIHHERIKR